MAKLENFIPFLFQWEGGYVNDPADAGGPTKMGVTLKTWKAHGYDKNDDGVINENDVKLLSREDVIERILRPHYWNRWRADEIRSQALANILVDWVWGSGHYGITIPQGILGVKQDGRVGDKTLNAVNHYPNPEELFDKIKQMRRAFYNLICQKRPANKRFLKGWLNRLNDFKWIPMALVLCCLCSCRSATRSTSLKQSLTETVENRSTVTEQQERETVQQENRQWVIRDETITERVNVLLDTLQNIKEIHWIKTARHRVSEAEQQVEIRTSESGNKIQKQEVNTAKREDIRLEEKDKSRTRWWVWLTGLFVTGMILFWRLSRKN